MMSIMDANVFFKNIETLTLRRDNLLRKFRRLLRDYAKGRIELDDVLDILKTLRRSRRALTKLLRDRLGIYNDIREGYLELVGTLLEFTTIVAINEEEELLRRLGKVFEKKGVKDSNIFNELRNDLEEVKELSKLVTEFLNGLYRSR